MSWSAEGLRYCDRDRSDAAFVTYDEYTLFSLSSVIQTRTKRKKNQKKIEEIATCKMCKADWKKCVFIVSVLRSVAVVRSNRQTEGDWVYGGWCHKDAGDFPRRLLLLHHSVVICVVRVGI